MPDALYWSATPVETAALLDAIRERDEAFAREAARRAGFVAAEVRNTLRTKKSDRYWTADDFVRTPPRELTPEQMEGVLDRWAASQNARHEA